MTGTRPGEYKQGFRPGAWDLLLRDPGSQNEEVKTMSDYNQYDFTIKEEDLLRVLHDAAAHGCQPLVVINGMFYNLKLEQTSSAVTEDLF